MRDRDPQGHRRSDARGAGRRGVLLATLLAGGCGGAKGEATLVCEPSCPAGTRCTVDGCTPDGALDLSVPGGGGVDLAGGCGGPCPVETPHCRNGACVACLTDDHCPPGRVCRPLGNATACLTGCADDARCGGGTARCCDGACADTATDPSHCGACATACSGGHTIATCSDGHCASGPCVAPWDDCNGVPGDGCEAYLLGDPRNCGACGHACAAAHAIAGCGPSGCYVVACESGFDDCNGDPADGCETSVNGDARNCGACRVACGGAAHAKTGCANGACRLSGCDAGFADCDGDPRTGCEIAIASDRANCGGCGNACPQNLVCVNGGCTCQNCSFPNARSRCVNLACVLDACLPGFADCDHKPENGCEVNLGADAANCGQCGAACPVQSPVCSGGTCVSIVAGAKLWLAADTLNLGEGVAVAAWADKSGNGNDAVQPAQNRQPIFHLNVLNGQPAIGFDGTDDVLGIKSTTVVTSFSFFIVYRLNAGAAGQSVYYPVVFGGDQNVTGQYSGIETLNNAGGASPSILDIFAGYGNDARATLQDISAFGPWKVISSVTAVTSHTVTVRANGVDAMMTGTGADVAMKLTLGNATGTGWGGIGGVPTMAFGQYAAKADVAELLVYDSALSPQDRAIVETYLNGKYKVY